MDTKQVVRRFEVERQALAMMDHPNIAKVHDGGSTDSGHPYFVMELVKGIPITQFCDERKMSMPDRLELFQHVCHAAQHAHQKGVIHRDFKPSNVLVAMYDDRPVPKVIDFGVAKAISEPLTENTFFTRFGEVVGTLDYMSPEQAMFNQLDIDTRSDIYSLGAILYELLAGEPPFERERLKSQAFDETLRMIRNEEPTKPSARISSSAHVAEIATNRNTFPEKLGANIRGDLDWIVMKSLEKDRTRRYETANALADDIQRYLNDEPVVACPPLTMYRFRKFAKRNCGTLIASSIIATLLIVGTAVSIWQAIRATRAESIANLETIRAVDAELAASIREKEAKREAAIAKTVNEFVNVDLLGKASPHSQPNRDLRIRDALDTAAEKIKERFASQPVVKASIERTIGKSYGSLGEYEKSTQYLERALSVYREHYGEGDTRTIELELDLMWVLHDQRKYKLVRQRLEGIAQACETAFGESAEITLLAYWQLAEILNHLGETELAQEIYNINFPISENALGTRHPLTLRFMIQKGITFNKQKRFPEAEHQYRRSIELLLDVHGKNHPETINAMKALANAIVAQRRWPEAERHFRDVLKIELPVMGTEHPDSSKTKSGLAISLSKQGQYADAIAILREVLRAQKIKPGAQHLDTLSTHFNLASWNLIEGHHDEALRLFQELLPIVRRVLTPDHPLRTNTVRSLGVVLARSNRVDETANLHKEELEIQLRLLGPENEATHKTFLLLASSYKTQGKRDLAVELLEARVSILESEPSDKGSENRMRQLADCLHQLGKLLSSLGDFQGASSAWEHEAKVHKNLATLVPDDLDNLAEWGGSLCNAARHIQKVSVGTDVVDQKLDSCLLLLDEAELKERYVLSTDPQHARANKNLTIILDLRASSVSPR